MCAGVISSVEMSSRSLGLFCGFFVSQERSSPSSCRLIRSGSSVRNRIRPERRTVAGRFSTFLFNKASITASPHAACSCVILRRWKEIPDPLRSIGTKQLSPALSALGTEQSQAQRLGGTTQLPEHVRRIVGNPVFSLVILETPAQSFSSHDAPGS